MATYAELYTIARAGGLHQRITAAVAIQADVIRQESGATSNHANRLIWAKQATADPEAMALRLVWAVLAANAGNTSTQLNNASDAAVLSAVAAVVDIFATGA